MTAVYFIEQKLILNDFSKNKKFISASKGIQY